MNNQLGAIPLSSDILNKANIGLWAFELDEGKPPRMYVDDTMLGLIGLTEHIPPEDAYHAWFDHIDETSYGLVSDAVEKMSAGEHAEVQYPWHHPNGHTMMVRCGGVRNPEYTAGVRIEGTHQDVTEVIHFDEEALMRHKRQQIELVKSNLRADALKFVSDNDPDVEKFIDYFGRRIIEVSQCDQVIFCDNEGRRIVLNTPGIEEVPQELCSNCAFDNFEKNEHYTQDGVIIINDCRKGFDGESAHPDCPVKSSLIQQIYTNGRLAGQLNLLYLKDFHTFTDDGIDMMKTVAAYLGLLLGRISAKKAEEERKAKELVESVSRRDREIIEILASEYSSVYYIDLRTDELNPYTMNAETESEFGQIFNSGISYSEAFRLYVEKLIFPDDREMMLKSGSLENIRAELSGKKTFLTTYRSSDNKYSEMKFVKVGGENDEPTAVALGFADKDAQIRDELDRKRYSGIANALSDKYDSIYYVNTEDDTYVHFHSNDSYTILLLTESGEHFFDECRQNLTVVTLPEDREPILDFINKEKLLRELEKGAASLNQYKLTLSGIPSYYAMRAIKPSPDDPHIIIAVENINDEVLQREKELAIQHQNYEIIEILASEYTSVYYIDLTTDGLTPYTMNAETETTFGSVFRSGITYSEAFRLYVDKLVFAEDKPMMLKAGSIGSIIKELRTKKTFLTTYRNAEEHYSEMKFVKVGNEDGAPTAVALGFADKDAELRAKQEEERILQRNIDIIEILASEYSSVYYIDMTTDELDPYTMNEQTETQFGQIFRNGIKYSEAFRMYVDKLVYPDDKQIMLKAGSVYNILNELSSKKTFTTLYRNFDGEYCEMKFVKVGEEENPQSVALGFANRDEEIRADILRKQKRERDLAVISGLSDDFGCVVYTAYDYNSEIHYRFDPLFEKHIEGWSKINNFRQRLDRLISTVMHPDDRSAFYTATSADMVRAAVDRDGVYYVNFRTLIDGEVTYYQAKFARDELHPDTNVIAGFHNVDAETKREMEAIERARSASKAKTDFLFNMSHDIRTPMNAIIGFTNIAMKHIDNREKVTDCLAKTREASELLLSLINNILDMSRIESGKINLDENAGDVYLSFASIESTMQELAKAKNISLTFEIDNITDRYIYADFARCIRVFVNIITNAIKYTNEGGYVKVRCTQIGKRDNCGIFRFTFEDNGIGMSEEFQKRAFDEFSREKTATVSGIQGTGLGLSVCRSFVTAMNGTIECRSKQGEGTTFTVTLPFRIQKDRLYTDPVSGELLLPDQDYHEPDFVGFTGKRVLLVEDNAMNREIAMDILAEAGFIIETAEDGVDAVDAVSEKGATYYDFILMDIQMPIINGYEATMKIRQLPDGDKIPIIALSANAFKEDIDKSLEAGMNGHIAKPIDVKALLETMRRLTV